MMKINFGVKIFMAFLIVASLVTFYVGVGMYMKTPPMMPSPITSSPEPVELFDNISPEVSMLTAFIGFLILLGSVSLAVGMNMFKTCKM